MRRIPGLVAMVVAPVLLAAVPGGAEVFPVPASVRALPSPHDEVHALRRLEDDVRIGEQRSRAVVEGDRLDLYIVTEFEDGEHWDEHAVMSLGDGYRAVSFRKVGRRNGTLVGEEHVDFASGRVTWTLDGTAHEEAFQFTPDTYTGPMLALVLAHVPQKPDGSASFHMLTFRPAPSVYTIEARVIDEELFRVGRLRAPTTKIRLKADLGPMQNMLLASLIPTHYFWFTRESTPEFFAFEGQLGHDGAQVLMVPEAAPAVHAAAGQVLSTLAAVAPASR